MKGQRQRGAASLLPLSLCRHLLLLGPVSFPMPTGINRKKRPQWACIESQTELGVVSCKVGFLGNSQKCPWALPHTLRTIPSPLHPQPQPRAPTPTLVPSTRWCPHDPHHWCLECALAAPSPPCLPSKPLARAPEPSAVSRSHARPAPCDWSRHLEPERVHAPLSRRALPSPRRAAVGSSV